MIFKITRSTHPYETFTIDGFDKKSTAQKYFPNDDIEETTVTEADYKDFCEYAKNQFESKVAFSYKDEESLISAVISTISDAVDVKFTTNVTHPDYYESVDIILPNDKSMSYECYFSHEFDEICIGDFLEFN